MCSCAVHNPNRHNKKIRKEDCNYVTTQAKGGAASKIYDVFKTTPIIMSICSRHHARRKQKKDNRSRANEKYTDEAPASSTQKIRKPNMIQKTP